MARIVESQSDSTGLMPLRILKLTHQEAATPAPWAKSDVYDVSKSVLLLFSFSVFLFLVVGSVQ